MLRKAFAGLLSALLIGAASLAPGVVNAQTINAPADSALLMGNIHSFGYTINGDYGNPGGNSGGAWWGAGFSTEVAKHSGTVTTLWYYANCHDQGANGGTCSSGGTEYMGFYVNGALTTGGSCSFSYDDGGSHKWDHCDITAVTVTKGDTYYIGTSLIASAGQQADHFGLGKDSSTSQNGSDIACSATGVDPNANPPANVLSAGGSCSSRTIDDGVAATGNVTDVPGLPGPSVGVTTGANHTTTVGGHKVQFYRFQNVPGATPGLSFGVSNLIEFFADSTTVETTGWNGAIYADSSGVPGSLIAECNGSGQNNAYLPIRKGEWNYCTTTPVTLSPGNSYWIGIWNADSTNNLFVDDQTNGSTNTECLLSSAQTTPFNPGSSFVTTGDTPCTNKFGLVNAGPLT